MFLMRLFQVSLKDSNDVYFTFLSRLCRIANTPPVKGNAHHNVCEAFVLAMCGSVCLLFLFGALHHRSAGQRAEGSAQHSWEHEEHHEEQPLFGAFCATTEGR